MGGRLRVVFAFTLALAVAGDGGPASAVDLRLLVVMTDSLGPPPVGLDFRNKGRMALVGEEILLRNKGSLPHELEDTTGVLRLGPVHPRSDLLVRPPWSGTYELRDRLEPTLEGAARWEHMTLEIGPFMEQYRRRPLVRWALAPAPEGYVFDVQRIDRSATSWRVWKRGVTRTSSSFRYEAFLPLSCIGFRARLRYPGDPDRTLEWGQGYVTCVVV